MKILITLILVSVIAALMLLPGDNAEINKDSDINMMEKTVIADKKASSPGVPEFDSGRVLIAYEETRYKSALVEKISLLLKNAGLEVVTAKHSEAGFNPENIDEFDAVFISNSGVNSEIRPWIARWLKANQTIQSRIILHTTQNSKWDVNVEVDSVTSASKEANVETLAEEYSNKIKSTVHLRVQKVVEKNSNKTDE